MQVHEAKRKKFTAGRPAAGAEILGAARNAIEAAEFKELRERMVFRAYGAGSEIFFEGDECQGVYFVESGIVGIRKTNIDGDTALLHLVMPGQPFGYDALLSNREQSTSAECIKAARIGFIDRAAFLKFLETKPELVFKLLRYTLDQLHEADDKIFQSQTLSVRSRFARVLCEIGARMPQKDKNGGLVFELPINRRYLSELIGVRPETLSRTIREFENDGVAKFMNRMVRVPNLETLLCETEPAHAA